MTSNASTPIRDRADAYEARDLARLAGLSVDQLRRWRANGLLPAAHKSSGEARYRFQDLIAARAAKRLLAEGICTRHVREAVEAIRTWDLQDAHPLAALKIQARQGRLVVRLDEGLVEARMRIHLDGGLVWSGSRRLENGVFWDVGAIHWGPEGLAMVGFDRVQTAGDLWAPLSSGSPCLEAGPPCEEGLVCTEGRCGR